MPTSSVGQLSMEEKATLERVSAMKDKMLFWSGSLSDFVYAIDTLATHGFLKANELEEAVAATIQHQANGQEKPKKLTKQKIDARRRNINSTASAHKPSEKIKNTLSTMLENLPSKKKDKQP